MSANKQLLLGNVASGTYELNAVKFDGANDYLTRGADLTGIADGTAGLFSAWVRLDDADAVLQTLLANLLSTARFNVTRTAANKFRFFARTSVPATILDQATTATYQASAKWIHLLASWDLTATTAYIYINDVADVTSTTKTNGTIDYVTATPNWSVGSETDGTNKFYGSLSEVYFTNTFLDISNSTNRRKFIDASGLPVSLGSDGSTPTGTAPIVYLKGDSSAFGVNSGTGGNFTVNGALEKASSTPATPAVNAVSYLPASGQSLALAGDWSSAADSKSGMLSMWYRVDETHAAASYVLVELSASKLSVGMHSSDVFGIRGKNAAGTQILSIATSSANTFRTASPKWYHILASWDLATTTTHLYVDDVSDKVVTTATNDSIDYTGTGGWSAFYQKSASVAEFYFAPGQYLDLSVQANREKFILNGAPVSLGSDGSLPTGVAPAIYLPNRAALVGTNAGTGGNFTINGAPKDANSTPLYYYAEPAKFDGTNDYLTRGGDLTGIADGKAGTISFWIRLDGGDGTYRMLLRTPTDAGLVQIYACDGSNKIFIEAYNTVPSQILKLVSATAYTAGPLWRHVIASWDLAAGLGYLYVNNASDLAASPVLTNSTIDYTHTNWCVGADISSSYTNKLNGSIVDLWFNTTYLDISQASNRAKFIDQTTLRPVPLGAKGELPTGSQPLLYLGRDYANFQTNLGSGGNFTVTGALERGTTSPSDVRA